MMILREQIESWLTVDEAAALLEAEPWVPEGLMLSLMYPYKPLLWFPQLSSG